MNCFINFSSPKPTNLIPIKDVREAIGSVSEIKSEEETNVCMDFIHAKNPKQSTIKRKALEPIEYQLRRLETSKDFIQDYGPQLNYSYNLWNKNSKVLSRADIGQWHAKNPTDWSVDDVCDYLQKVCDDETVAKFGEQRIDGDAFVCMSQDDLVSLLGIKMGIAIKIFNRVLHLREEIMLNFMKL